MYLFVNTIQTDFSILFLLLYSFLLHAIIPISVHLMSYKSDIYVSNKLESTTYRITKKLKIERCYEHKIKKKSSRLPIILYTIDLVFSMSIPFIIFVLVQGHDRWICLAFAVLTLVTSFILWKKELNEFVDTYRQDTYLLLIEMCYMPLTPGDTTLLFRDRDHRYYTWVTRSLEGFEIGKCYMAHCYGTHIESLQNEGRDKNSIRYIPKRVYSSHRAAFGFIPAVLLICLGSGSLVLYVTIKNSLLLATAIACILNGALAVPWPHTRKLTTTALRHSCMYRDLSKIYAYTFVLTDRFGNIFYYQTDDYKVLEEDATYRCFCFGRYVKSVKIDDEYIGDKFYPRDRQPILGVNGLAIIAVVSIIVLELLGLSTASCLLLGVLITFYVRLFRYANRGEF